MSRAAVPQAASCTAGGRLSFQTDGRRSTFSAKKTGSVGQAPDRPF